jgi:hypothetical protein
MLLPRSQPRSPATERTAPASLAAAPPPLAPASPGVSLCARRGAHNKAKEGGVQNWGKLRSCAPRASPPQIGAAAAPPPCCAVVLAAMWALTQSGAAGSACCREDTHNAASSTGRHGGARPSQLRRARCADPRQRACLRALGYTGGALPQVRSRSESGRAPAADAPAGAGSRSRAQVTLAATTPGQSPGQSPSLAALVEGALLDTRLPMLDDALLGEDVLFQADFCTVKGTPHPCQSAA